MTIPKYAGPWEEHVHGFGCDCGYLPRDSPMRTGRWWARHNYEGREIAVAWTEEMKAEADARLARDGWILMAAPPAGTIETCTDP